MQGRCKRHAKGFHSDLLKLEHVGKGLERAMEVDEGKSSPKRHCPQKAVVAQAVIAALKGE